MKFSSPRIGMLLIRFILAIEWFCWVPFIRSVTPPPPASESFHWVSEKIGSQKGRDGRIGVNKGKAYGDETNAHGDETLTYVKNRELV